MQNLENFEFIQTVNGVDIFRNLYADKYYSAKVFDSVNHRYEEITDTNLLAITDKIIQNNAYSGAHTLNMICLNFGINPEEVNIYNHELIEEKIVTNILAKINKSLTE